LLTLFKRGNQGSSESAKLIPALQPLPFKRRDLTRRENLGSLKKEGVAGAGISFADSEDLRFPC
jgi:hypothetical protein